MDSAARDGGAGSRGGRHEAGRREKTEKKLKTVVDTAERSASRMVDFILEERRGRERREAAAVELKKKGVQRRTESVKAPRKAKVSTEARRQPETSAPPPARPEGISQGASAAVSPPNPAALTEMHQIAEHRQHRSDLAVMLEVSSGLALEESGDCVVKDLSKWQGSFAHNPVVAPRSFHWHAREVKVSHKMLMNLTNTDMEMLASFERPPHVVKLVMHAVHELLGIHNQSWAGMKKMLNVDVPKPEDRHNEPLPHEQFQAALAESASHKSWRPAGDKASEYPTPVKHQHVARIIKLVLEYTGQGRDPKQVLKLLKKYVSNPEFTPENAGKWSKAALALCVWVHAVALHYKELKRKPGRWQIEKAIEHGTGHLRFPSNTRVVDWLPDIAAKTNKSMGTKSYHDLVTSKNLLVRKVFHHPPPQLHAEFREAPDVCERVGFVRDVDVRATYVHFKSNLQDRLSVSVKELQAKEQPALTALCKFDHPAFASEAAGRRSWERFSGMDQGNVRFEDGMPRPVTVERKAKHAEDLNAIYQTDVLTRKLLGAIEVNDQDAVRRLVFAGADLDWTDDKGRTVFDIAKELRQMACYKILDTCRLRLHQVRTKAHVTLRHTSLSHVTLRHTKPVVLPRIELAVPPRTHHGKRRKPLKVVTYRKHVAVIEDKYQLQDANEYVTESEQSSSSSEEEVDREVKLRANTRRFMQEFLPPLTPPELSKRKLALESDRIASSTEHRPSAVDESLSSEFLHTRSSMERTASTSIEGVQGEDIGHVHSDGIDLGEAMPSLGADESTAAGEMSTQSQEASGSTFLTDVPGINDAGGDGEATSIDKDDVRPRTRSTTQSQQGRRERDKFIKREEGRTKSKRELFNILWNGVVSDAGNDPRIIPIKGGIDDEAVTSQRHNYLRKCRELQIMPRPLIFGQPDPEHINLRRFGLRAKQCKALAEALEGMDTCKSLNLSENQLGGDGIRAVCKVLANNKVLTSLDLSSCQLRNSSQDLVDLLTLNRTITQLSLAGNDLSERVLSKLLEVIQGAGQISSLNISRNFCGSSALQSLISLIEESHISDLDVSWTGLRLPFMESMENVLNTNRYLTSLNLSYNGLCDDSMNVLAQLFVDTIGDATSSMALKHLDLGHNRIQKKGAICLALALQKVADVMKDKPDVKFSLQNVVLNGNSIGEVGIRACLHAMGYGQVDLNICQCLPDSACDDFFEHGIIEKTYELDLSDFHDRLVADRLIKVANARFQGKRIIQSAIYDEKELSVPDTGPDWTEWDWDPMYYDDGTLELVVDGPWSYFTCRFVDELEGVGSYFDVDLSLDAESDAQTIAPPDASKLIGKKVYFEFAGGAESEMNFESEMSLVKCFARELEVKGVWDEAYEDTEQENERGHQISEDGGGVRIHVFRVQMAHRAEWEVKGLPIRIGSAAGTMHKCEEKEDGIYLHVKNLAEAGSLLPPKFKYKHQQVDLKYDVFAISSLFDEDQVAAFSEANTTCKCWYIDSEPLLPMEDAAFKKLLPVLETILATGGEDRLLQILLGVAKDASLTTEQAIVVAHMFSHEKRQRLIYQQFCGAPMEAPKEKRKKKRKVKIKRHTIDDDDFVRNMEAADTLFRERHMELLDEGAYEASAGTFFDLFSGVLALTRLDDETSDNLNVETQASMRGVAFAFFDADAALPSYDFKSLQFAFTKEPEDKIVKVDFKIIAIKEEQRTILLQDQAIAANDGGSGAYSLMQLTEQGATYRFEFPSRDAARVATQNEEGPGETPRDGVDDADAVPVQAEGESQSEHVASAEDGMEEGNTRVDAHGSMWDNVELSVSMSSVPLEDLTSASAGGGEE